MIYALCLLLAAAPVDLAEEDAATLFPADAQYARYLYLDSIDEKDRDQYMSVVSFVLNSLSTQKKIIQPKFVNKEKTLIRFDVRDYGFDVKAYNSFPKDPYTKQSDKLKLLLKSERGLMRVDWFIIKAMDGKHYYKMMGVSDLKDFRKRHRNDPADAKKLRVEQGAVVVLSNVARNTRYIKRTATETGAIWESRDSISIDYLMDLLSEKYDSIQLLATNPNGLLSYFAADGKGKPLDYLPVEVAVDHTKAFEPDLTVRIARNCVACHHSGIVPIDDRVRKLIKENINLLGPDKDAKDRLADLFMAELPVKQDQDAYVAALKKTTGMEPKDFTKSFIEVFQRYYADVTLEQAAKEMGQSLDDFKQYCLESGQAHIVYLALRGKIHRVHFESAIEAK